MYFRIILVVVFGTLMISGCMTSRTEDQIRSQIETTVPVGSSKESVIYFLKANGFTYVTNPEFLPRPNGINGEWITARLRQRMLWREYDIKVDLFFDTHDQSLRQYTVVTSYPASSF